MISSNNQVWRLSLTLGVACAVGACAVSEGAEPLTLHSRIESSFAPPSTCLDQLTSPIRRTDLQLRSAASCAASACHGGPRPGITQPYAARGSEYPLWLQKDPHAQSWRTFCSDQSVRMMEHLKIMRNGEVIDRAGYDNCLGCHNTTKKFQESRSTEFIAEGIGCSSCHGPSQNWNGDHFRFQWDDNTSASVGLVPNKNLVARARVCASCHVGDRDRDMNHDIIAAGHPALHYEFATFYTQMPKHWRDDDQYQAQSYEAKLWLAGQIAALDASLSLLESRTQKSLPGISQWPEFAASDCSSCHQSMRIGSEDYSQPLRSAFAKLSNWNRFGIEQLLKQRSNSGMGQPLLASLDNLERAMSSKPRPDPQFVAAQSTAVRVALDRWLCSSEGQNELNHFSADKLRQLVANTGNNIEALKNWETASQFYLAAVASRAAWLEPNVESDSLKTARSLRGSLLFKAGSNSLALPDNPNREKSVKSQAAELAGFLASSFIAAPPPSNFNPIQLAPMQLAPIQLAPSPTTPSIELAPIQIVPLPTPPSDSGFIELVPTP